MKSKLTPEKELAELQDLQKKLLSQHTDVRNRIEDLETKIHTPALKKELIGKYYVYENSYGSGKKWLLYYHVIDVESPYSIIVNSFQTMPYNEYKFEVKTSINQSLLQRRITKRQYQAAVKKFLKQAISLK